MKRIVLLVVAVLFLAGCNKKEHNSETENVTTITTARLSETWPLLLWYSPEDDAFFDRDSIESDEKICFTIPRYGWNTFVSSGEKKIELYSKSTIDTMEEISNFSAYDFDSVELWFVKQEDRDRYAQGDSTVDDDFIIILYYGEHEMKFHGVVR